MTRDEYEAALGLLSRFDVRCEFVFSGGFLVGNTAAVLELRSVYYRTKTAGSFGSILSSSKVSSAPFFFSRTGAIELRTR